MEYLIRTYSNEGDLVHDSTMGRARLGWLASTPAVASSGIERDPGYFAIAEEDRRSAAGDSFVSPARGPGLMKWAAAFLVMVSWSLLGHPSQEEVYFSPSGGVTAAVVKEIATSKREILMQAYGFTSLPIATALIDSAKRGVKVSVILDRSNRTAGFHVAVAGQISHHRANRFQATRLPTTRSS
jgi:phosphatidylserine/phosphatidylglycerophosphate/cardiolipin synthase-like enzyme